MTLTQATETPEARRPRRARRLRIVAGSAALALAAGIGSQLAGEQPAAGATASSYPFVMTTSSTTGGSLTGDDRTFFFVNSFAWSTTAKLTANLPNGKLTIGDLILTRPTGAGSIPLANVYKTNQRLTTVNLAPGPFQPGQASAPRSQFSYQLTNCAIVEIGHNGGSDASGTEQVKLRCAAATMTSQPLKNDGSQGPTSVITLP